MRGELHGSAQLMSRLITKPEPLTGGIVLLPRVEARKARRVVSAAAKSLQNSTERRGMDSSSNNF
jgi:hypothetical protein